MVKAPQHQVYGTELKNIMERFIQQHIKDRTLSVLMNIFLAGRRRKIVIERTCVELVEIIHNLFTYGQGQNNTVYDILGKGWRLS